MSYSFATPRTVAHQAPPGFSRQEYWSGLPLPSPRDLSPWRLTQGSNPHLLYWQVDSLPLSHQRHYGLSFLKHRSYYHLSTVKPIDQFYWDDSLLYSQIPREEGITWDSSRVSQNVQGVGKNGVRAFTVVSLGGKRQGRINKLKLTGSNHFSRLWGLEAIPCCLVIGPGVVRAGGKCESLIEEVTGATDFG